MGNCLCVFLRDTFLKLKIVKKWEWGFIFCLRFRHNFFRNTKF